MDLKIGGWQHAKAEIIIRPCKVSQIKKQSKAVILKGHEQT